MDLLFLCSWVVTYLCFGSVEMLPSVLLVMQHKHNVIVITAFHPQWEVAAAPYKDAVDLSLTGWCLSSFQHHVYKTFSDGCVEFHEILEGNKCTERILRVKRIRKSLQRNRQIQSWAKMIGINELPNEVERVQAKLSNVPSVFGVSSLLMLLQLLQGLNIIVLVLLQLL